MSDHFFRLSILFFWSIYIIYEELIFCEKRAKIFTKWHQIIALGFNLNNVNTRTRRFLTTLVQLKKPANLHSAIARGLNAVTAVISHGIRLRFVLTWRQMHANSRQVHCLNSTWALRLPLRLRFSCKNLNIVL